MRRVMGMHASARTCVLASAGRVTRGEAVQVRAVRLMVDHHEEVAPATVVPALQARPTPAAPVAHLSVSSGVLRRSDQRRSSTACPM